MTGNSFLSPLSIYMFLTRYSFLPPLNNSVFPVRTVLEVQAKIKIAVDSEVIYYK